MYNHSYKGSKKSKYKSMYSGRYGSISGGRGMKIKKERGTAHLQVIRVVAVLLVLVLVIGGITVGFCVYGGESTVYENAGNFTTKDNSKQLLRVVNRTNPIEKDYVPELKDYNGVQVSSLAYASLEKMVTDAEKAGLKLAVKKGYVSYEEQGKAYKAMYKKLKSKKSLSQVKAQAQTQVITPQSGKSEYQTGLLLYFDSTEKYKDFTKTKVFHWLDNNCVKYGFVLRYTKSKENKTTMKANSHQFRYVGEENSSLMRRLDMCLDEYYSYVNAR